LLYHAVLFRRIIASTLSKIFITYVDGFARVQYHHLEIEIM